MNGGPNKGHLQKDGKNQIDHWLKEFGVTGEEE